MSLAGGSEAKPARGLSLSKPLLAILGAGLAVRLVVAALVGPNVDETYIAVISRTPALGYVDHPPMAMWIAALVRWTTGSEAIFLLRLPFVLMFTATTLLIHAVADRLFGRAAALAAVMALSLSPLISVYLGTFVLTDGPLLLFVSVAALSVVLALEVPSPGPASRWWLVAGLATGLGLLAKYTALFFPAGVGLFLLTSPRYRGWLLRPAPWLGLALAVLVFSPVVWWNAGHAWVSFAFQGERATPGLAVEPLRLVVNLALQAVYYFPPIWVGLVVTLWNGIRAGPAGERSWLVTCLAIGPIAFFALVWLLAADDNKGFHWAAAGYLLLFPYYGQLIVERERQAPGQARRWFVASAAVLAVILAGHLGHVVTGWGQKLVPGWTTKDAVLADQVDWRDLRTYMMEHGLFDPDRYVVAATGWEQCVRADYGLRGTLRVVCLTAGDSLLPNKDGQEALRGKAIVLVSLSPELAGTAADFAAGLGGARSLGAVELGNYGVTAMTVWLFLVANSPAP